MQFLAKKILQKVVDKKRLSENEVGDLEGIIANEKLNRCLNTGDMPTATARTSKAPLAVKKTRMAFRKIDDEIAVFDRRRQVMEYRMQHPPMTVRAIAAKMEISVPTVLNDMQAIRDRHNRILDTRHTMRLLGQTVEQYDILHGKALALADSFTSPMAKAALLRTAISALDSKSRLMGETGVIHRVPERQEILVAHTNVGSVKERVARLIRAQEERTSPTLELPAAEDDADGAGMLPDEQEEAGEEDGDDASGPEPAGDDDDQTIDIEDADGNSVT